ncbi:hypothetical protein RM543_12885 [Roseicyclus sp. F158]|uniref:Uncharacterized protein n=1 Tax=Tropicimonas omnivorans TaxID=3075590 RepID=A0ABU3DIN7_9RHOB|nr:hypothetical protein [Roseicyclus sp. F158]MDT0683584.1 hypothetical protein [Roseicyclus sp. F158]
MASIDQQRASEPQSHSGASRNIQQMQGASVQQAPRLTNPPPAEQATLFSDWASI